MALSVSDSLHPPLTPMIQRKRSMPALTGMRIFLALWVVLFHRLTGNRAELAQLPNSLSSILLTGYCAVSVFFVLSGFVLAYSYSLDHHWTKREYWSFASARFSRLYPSYLLGLLLLVPLVAWRLFHTWDFIDPLNEAFTAFLNFTLLQSWLPWTALTWNDPGWSLSNEAFFYACFPIVGVLVWRAAGKGKLFTTSLILWAVTLAGPLIGTWIPIHGYGDIVATVPQAADLSSPSSWAIVLCANPLMRIPEFCVGILLGRLFSDLHDKQSSLFGKGYLFYIPGILVVLATLSQAHRIAFPTVHHGLLLPAYSCIILGFALDGGLLARFLSLPALVFLGNASYSVYILHVPIFAWLTIAWKRLSSQPEAPVPVWLYLAVVLLISCLNYAFMEEPLHKRLKSGLQGYFQRKTASLPPTDNPSISPHRHPLP